MEKLKTDTFNLHKWEYVRQKRAELQTKIDQIKAKRRFVDRWQKLKE